ncbi:TPA: hypothetical protein N0F65_005875, partial [Lagenidium giganteum]
AADRLRPPPPPHSASPAHPRRRRGPSASTAPHQFHIRSPHQTWRSNNARSPPGSPPQRQRFLSSALPQTSFPLPDCFFPAVKLTEDKCNQYETIIKATVVEALQEMADHEVNGEGLQYSTPWKLVGEADSLVTYKRADPSNAAVTQARTFGRINGRPNDVLDFFYTDSSREVLKLNELLYHKVMDARVIHNIRTRTDTARHSYLGIKWVAYQPTSSVHRRDNCFLEYMGYAKDAKGRHVGFCASLPIKVRECPDLGDTMRLPRIRTRNVVLVRESDSQPERTHVYVTGAYDTNDSSGDMTMILKRYMGNLRNLSLLRDSKDISQQQMIARVNWVPDHQRKSCKMCQRSFGATRHRHHCRLCGEVVCRKCFVVRTVSKSESSDKPPKMVKRKFCTMCVTSLRRRDSDSPEAIERSERALSNITTLDELMAPICATATMPPSYLPSPSSSASILQEQPAPIPGNGGRFPVPKDFFPPIQISDEQLTQYEFEIEELIQSAFRESAKHEAVGGKPVYQEPWKFACELEDLTTYKQAVPDKPSAGIFRVFGTTNVDYRQFMEFYYADSSRDLFEYNQFCFGYVLDAVVLGNIRTETTEEPHRYLGFKWVVYQPLPILPKRDNCFLEYMTYRKDTQGRDVGVRVMLPVSIPECPDMLESMKVKRMGATIVNIVREVEGRPGAMNIFLMGQVDFRDNYVTNSYYRSYLNVLRNMATYVDSKRLSRHGLLSRAHWVPNHFRRSCSVCFRAFNMTRHRHHCRLCGDIVCRKCSITRAAMNATSQKLHKTKFCVRCVTRVRETSLFNCSTLLTSSKSAKPLGFSAVETDDTCSLSSWPDDRLSVSGVIDTKDMTRWPPRPYEDRNDMIPLSAAFPTPPSAAILRDTRSIDQCLAEQQDLLRRMQLAASCSSISSRTSRPSSK